MENKELWVIVGENVKVKVHECQRLIGDHHYISENKRCEFCGKELKED